MVAAGFGYIVLFFLFVLAKSRFPDAGGGWSDPPIFDYLHLLGAGICISILATGYTYYSWTLNEEEYIEWYTDQQWIGRKFMKTWSRVYPKGWIIWNNRIVGPIAALFGIALIEFALFSIFDFIFG